MKKCNLFNCGANHEGLWILNLINCNAKTDKDLITEAEFDRRFLNGLKDYLLCF